MDEREFYAATKERKLHGAYLLTGEEELTKQDALERVVALLQADFKELNYQSFQGIEAKELLYACDQWPFMDDIRVIRVTEWDADTAKALCKGDALLKLPESTVLLLVQRGEVKKTDPLFKLLSPQNRVVVFETLTKDRAVNMLMREAALRDVTLNKALAGKLVDMVGVNAYRLKNEFSKAADYTGKGHEVTEQTLLKVVSVTEEFMILELLDSLLNGKKKQAISMLYRALKDGDSPMGIAAFLTGRLKQLLVARECLDMGQTQQSIAKQLGGNPHAVKYILRDAQKRSASELRSMIEALQQVDIMLKQGLAEDEEALMSAVFTHF